MVSAYLPAMLLLTPSRLTLDGNFSFARQHVNLQIGERGPEMTRLLDRALFHDLDADARRLARQRKHLLHTARRVDGYVRHARAQRARIMTYNNNSRRQLMVSSLADARRCTANFK